MQPSVDRPIVPLRLLQKPGAGDGPEIVSVLDVAETTGEGRRLRCARCRHEITTTAARITVNGRHEWERVNPHGWVWRFGCFSSAPGCASQGVPSKQATWFAAYFWQIQVCGGCGELLGWLWFNGDHQFHGLILDHLVEEEPESRPG